MKFVYPALLVGLLAAALPLIIHLINRQRAPRQPFPAMAFLLRSQEKLARSLKIRQWLLLAARVSVFVLLPLAMAQPYALCGGDRAGEAGDRLPASVVFVIDDSGSMSYTDGGGSSWERAVEQARDEIRDLRSWDTAAVIVAGDEPELVIGDFIEDRSRLQAAVAEWEPRYGGGDIPEALALARELQLDSEQPSRRTVVISDGTRVAWEQPGADIANATGLGRLTVIDASTPERRSNVRLVSVSMDEAADSQDGGQVVSVNLERTGEVAEEIALHLEIDGERRGTTQASFGAASTTTATFQHYFGTGEASHTLRVSVDEPEGLTSDNTLEMPLALSRNIRALLVNGDARTVSYNDEFFYLDRALRATLADERGVEADVTTPAGLTDRTLESYDVVVLSNVDALPASEVDRLRQFTADGGGVWLTLGDKVVPERWNSLFEPLLPRSLRSVTRLSEPTDPDANIKATRLAAPSGQVGLFRDFSAPGGQSLQTARVYQYVLLEPEARQDTTTLASFVDGSPALVERRIGSGSVLLWTSTVDLDWTDLPIRTTFLPFAQRVIEHLARRGGSAGERVQPGQIYRIRFAREGVERARVVSPAGREDVVSVRDGVGEYTPEESGVHRVLVSVDERFVDAPELAFTVSPRAEESDLERVAVADVAAWTDAAASGVTPGGERVDLPENRARTWPILLFVLLVVLYAESLLGFQRRFWSKLRGSTERKDPFARD